MQLPPSVNAQPLNAAPHTASELILNIFPENIAKSVAEGQLLQVVIFSILFGMALALVKEEKRRPLVALAESLAETMFKFTNIVMFLAPIGVCGAIAYTVGHVGLGVLYPLLKLLATMYAALIVFLLFVLLPIALIVRVPLAAFLRAIAEPVTIAFATSTSEAALPRAMETMEALGVPRSTVAFVLPTGYSFNLDGSSLYQSLALIFVAQAAGIHLTIGQQIIMMLTLLVSSKGTAGVARASLVIVLAAAASFHLPMEPIFLLFGIDQLMDMARTAVNVAGNCLATVVIARWEGEFHPAPTAKQQIEALVNLCKDSFTKNFSAENSRPKSTPKNAKTPTKSPYATSSTTPSRPDKSPNALPALADISSMRIVHCPAVRISGRMTCDPWVPPRLLPTTCRTHGLPRRWSTPDLWSPELSPRCSDRFFRF